ncbi:MAG: helix-turn-helix transcriptional regulator [Acidobacteria bacterium]|nr:helix-turn-helix transcriptional regulator [Acidobacteriota bacterium]
MVKRRKQIQPRSGVERAFGEVLRAIREELGVSQMKLHVKTGLDRTFISDLERGLQCPSLRTIYRIAAGLEVPATNLIRRTTESRYFVLPTDED